MRRFALPAAAIVVLLSVTPVVAGTGFTYHGSITDGTFTCGSTEVTPYGTVEGTWNLNVSGNAAVVTLNVFYDGRHHLSFGMPGGTVVGTATAESATVTFGQATALIADGLFTWSVPLAVTCPSGYPYDHLIYSGEVGR